MAHWTSSLWAVKRSEQCEGSSCIITLFSKEISKFFRHILTALFHLKKLYETGDCCALCVIYFPIYWFLTAEWSIFALKGFCFVPYIPSHDSEVYSKNGSVWEVIVHVSFYFWCFKAEKRCWNYFIIFFKNTCRVYFWITNLRNNSILNFSICQSGLCYFTIFIWSFTTSIYCYHKLWYMHCIFSLFFCDVLTRT